MKLLEKELERLQGMWFVTNNIGSQFHRVRFIMFVDIRVLRLCSTDWKSSLTH